MEENTFNVALFLICTFTLLGTIDLWFYSKKLAKENKTEVEVKEEKIIFPNFYIIYIEDYEILRMSEAENRLIYENAFLYENDLLSEMTRITFNEIVKFEMAVNILSDKHAKFNIEFEYLKGE